MIKFGLPGQETAFNVVSQSIEEDEGLIKDRTVFGRLRTFRHLYKADINLELDWILEADYFALSKIIRNGVTRERIFIPHPSENSIFDYVSALHKAYKQSSASASLALMTSGTYEFTVGDYNNIKYYDGGAITENPTAGQYEHFHFTFDATGFYSLHNRNFTKRLLFLIIGLKPLCNYIASIWNYETLAWEDIYDSETEGLIDTAPASNNTIGIASLPIDINFRDFEKYITAAYKISFRIRSKELSQGITLNYPALYINGFNVVQDSPQIDLNFRERFDGAGYRGTLKLIEV